MGRLTFGIPYRYFCDRVDDDVASALARARAALTEAGHEVVDVEIAHAAWTPDVYLHVMLPEASWYHAPLLERHASSYSPGVRLRLEMGRYVRAEDYVRARHLREVLRESVNAALADVDALLLPTLPMAAPVLGAQTVPVAGKQEPVRGAMLRLTQMFNVTGHPSIALPAGKGRDGMPRGLQLVGREAATISLLRAALVVERQISGGAGSVGGGTGLNLRMVAYVWLTRRDRRVHRRRLLDYIWRMRCVRDWWLLDHAEGGATTKPVSSPAVPRIETGRGFTGSTDARRIRADLRNYRGSVGCQ